jgi:hypothetical protein
MSRRTRSAIWKSLLAATVAGVLNSLVVVLADPSILADLRRLALAAAAGGAIGLCGYLLKSPLLRP